MGFRAVPGNGIPPRRHFALERFRMSGRSQSVNRSFIRCIFVVILCSDHDLDTLDPLLWSLPDVTGFGTVPGNGESHTPTSRAGMLPYMWQIASIISYGFRIRTDRITMQTM